MSDIQERYTYLHATAKILPGECERIQKLLDRAQRASDRLAIAIAIATTDVINLRRLVAIQLAQKSHPDRCTYAPKKKLSTHAIHS